MLVALTYNLSQDQLNGLIKNCMGVLETDYKTINIPQERLEKRLEPDATVVSFGGFATTYAQQCIEEEGLDRVRLVTLPAPSKLVNKKENASLRQETLSILSSLKKELERKRVEISRKTILSTDLPDFEAQHLLVLKKLMEGRKSCYQTTVGGKLIVIGEEDKRVPADICLSFEELYTVKLIMELLGVKEVSIIAKD
jgi:hypothetical protein